MHLVYRLLVFLRQLQHVLRQQRKKGLLTLRYVQQLALTIPYGQVLLF
jgi:hypothetical protein